MEPLQYLEKISQEKANIQSKFLRPGREVPRWLFRISTVENIEKTCHEAIFLATGVKPDEATVSRANTTKTHAKKFPDFQLLARADIPDDLLARIMENNALDIALFNEVKAAGTLDTLPNLARV